MVKKSSKPTSKLFEIIGWAGIVLILTAYAGLNFGWMNQQHMNYQLLNLVGSVIIIFHSIKLKDYQPAILNIIWALIAMIAIISLFT